MVDQAVEGTLRISDFFREMGKEILKVLAKIIAQEIALGMVRMMFGGARLSLFNFNALGNAFSNGRVVPFANGGIVSGPTVFPMRDGMGMMGEAGPEAVMPLARNSRGQLGVHADGFGGGNTYITNYNVQTIDAPSFDDWLVKRKGTIREINSEQIHSSGKFRAEVRKAARGG